MQSEVAVPEPADSTLAVPRSEAVRGPANRSLAQAGGVPPQWLARLEFSQKDCGCSAPGDGSTR
ncbi:UNVERIFIED_CONTAM: hypothetical protein Slati_2651200 [Sesamum latifolium]|uniref:Uncharacterized protein n=1 Tax=Sesamum latifolium TaxID=2727402 RepID=A0AAW2VW68_9LAMI